MARKRSLYFIQEGDRGPIKIGVAHEVGVRLSGLQTGNPRELHLLAAFDAPDGYEKRLHELLDAYRLRGEWFAPSDAVFEAIEDCHEEFVIGPLLRETS